jgi:hypothetical protein
MTKFGDETGKINLTSDQQQSLAEELIQLNDDFAEFREINAFLCNAYATSLSDHDWLDKDIIAGARRCSSWLQSRSSKLNEDIRHVQERYTSEHAEAASPTISE